MCNLCLIISCYSVDECLVCFSSLLYFWPMWRRFTTHAFDYCNLSWILECHTWKILHYWVVFKAKLAKVEILAHSFCNSFVWSPTAVEATSLRGFLMAEMETIMCFLKHTQHFFFEMKIIVSSFWILKIFGSWSSDRDGIEFIYRAQWLFQ